MGKSSKPTSTTTQSSTTTPDSRVTGRASTIMDATMGYAMPDGENFRDYPEFSAGRDAPLGAEQRAGFNNFHKAALDTVTSAPGYEANFGNAQALAGPGNYAGNKVDTGPIGAFSTGEVSRFQNPYNDLVVRQGLDELGRSYDKARVDADHAAASAGAWGGSRQALVDGEVARNFADKASDFVGQQLASGYDRAVAARQGEIGNTLAITSADNAENQRALTNQLTLAGSGNQLASQQGALLQGAGDLLRGTEQEILDASRGELLRQEEYPLNLAQTLAAINSGTAGAFPVSSSGTSTGVQSGGPSKGSQLLGASISALPSLFKLSDEREKEDIRDDVDGEEVLGAFREMPVSSWQYTDDAQTEHDLDGERHVGPMAQDVEQAFAEPAPDMDGEGTKGIDVTSMLGKLAAAIKALDARTADLTPTVRDEAEAA